MVHVFFPAFIALQAFWEMLAFCGKDFELHD